MTTRAFATALEAETAFYEAFERANLEVMMSVWAKRDDILCIHPSGPRLVGVDQVRRGWREIFRSGSRLHFRLGTRRNLEGAGLFVSSLQEHIQVGGEAGSRHLVLATNIYVLTSSGWLMLAHHASPAVSLPEPPAESPILH